MTGPDHLPDTLGADRLSAPGGEPLLIVDAASWKRPGVPIQAVVIGVDRGGELPDVDGDDFDLLITAAASAPKPWTAADAGEFDRKVHRIADAVCTHPLAATTAAKVLRLAETLPLADALVVESLAYSTLLGGAEFARWLETNRAAAAAAATPAPVTIERSGDAVRVTLDDAPGRNAMTAAMRDALYEALANILDDPTRPALVLRGAGKCFSTGGALFEFGMARDLAEAHAVRTLHSCARALDALGPRATVFLHGACIGSGIEVAAAAYRRVAAPGSWFQLPELSMGLIPGAGGTATMARAIGRHRTMGMILTGERVDAAKALDWGLVHAIEPPR